MNWWRLLTALAVALLALVAGGALAGLVGVAASDPAALAVVGLLAIAVLAASRWGTAPNRWLSNPYWGR